MRFEGFVGSGGGEEAEDRGAGVEGQAPDAEHGEEQAGGEGVGAGEGAGGEQAERADATQRRFSQPLVRRAPRVWSSVPGEPNEEP